jgi:hypothetical protein
MSGLIRDSVSADVIVIYGFCDAAASRRTVSVVWPDSRVAIVPQHGSPSARAMETKLPADSVSVMDRDILSKPTAPEVFIEAVSHLGSSRRH